MTDEAREALQRSFGDWATVPEVKEWLMDAEEQAMIRRVPQINYIEYGPNGDIMYQGSITPVQHELLFNYGDMAAGDPACSVCGGSGISPDSPSPSYDDALSLTPCDCIWSKP